MPDRFIGSRRRRPGLLFAAIGVLVLLMGSRYIASTLIDYNWWAEIHQVGTWWNLLLYGTVPILLVMLVLFGIYWISFSAGMRQSKDTLQFGILSRSLVTKLGIVAVAFLSFVAANLTVDSWTVVRFFGGRQLATLAAEYTDPIFGRSLHFYLFDLPFLNMLVSVILAAALLAMLIYWLAAHAERIGRQLPSAFPMERSFNFDLLSIRETFESPFVRLAAVLILAGIATKLFLARYALLTEDHGQYLVGVDWLADHVVLPLQWLLIAGCVCAAALVAARKPRWALFLLVLLPVRWLLPSLVASLYVRPNELALEKPYIQHHIEATRAAYGLIARVKEQVLNTASEVQIDYSKHRALLDNVRLWDWRAFHDTISQIQPLRPYVYEDTDVDRYTIDGQLRQVLIAPRELQLSQIGEAATRWINPHLIYTHGYGLVMAEANRITTDGLPVLFIKDAPPVVASKSLQLTQPEIYYSEVAHEPVFVKTGQPEFNYPSGSENVQTKYGGTGGFPISSPLTRLAAGLHYADGNILLTEYLNDKSRMMIHRSIMDRLNTIAGFMSWDSDPYLVVTGAGRLVWMVDGYMSSESHPYSRAVSLGDRNLNYMRNSVKATVDAYDGETNLYIFDESDILIEAYARLFPGLFKPSSAMPADLRAHARYPETLFRVQAEIYRTFHMRDPEAFYNRADAWDFAKTTSQQADGSATTVSPTYVVAALPGSSTAEFMLLTTYTPANKDNLIGVMYARCDGEHLGELVFGQLAKQNIIYGPMQIAARVNQDQTISKDLSLWDQHGSSVLRGQTLVLPIDNSFLYVEPIYITSQTSMPQLKKVALAMGDKLAYADTYEQALAQLIEEVGGRNGAQAATPSATSIEQRTITLPAAAGGASSNQAAETLKQVRDHLQRYRDLNSQGKWAEAGKELEEIQKLLQQ